MFMGEKFGRDRSGKATSPRSGQAEISVDACSMKPTFRLKQLMKLKVGDTLRWKCAPTRCVGTLRQRHLTKAGWARSAIASPSRTSSCASPYHLRNVEKAARNK